MGIHAIHIADWGLFLAYLWFLESHQKEAWAPLGVVKGKTIKKKWERESDRKRDGLYLSFKKELKLIPDRKYYRAKQGVILFLKIKEITDF